MAVKVILSQSSHAAKAPLPYTADPLLLCCTDILLFFRCSWSIVGILFPVKQWPCAELDELYPSLANLWCLFLHGFLIVLQIIFLMLLPFTILLPGWITLGYVSAVLAVNFAVSAVLNGTEDEFRSKVDLGEDAYKHDDECWIYMNGVSVGGHWLQGNIDRLALTFRRPILGIHNRTYGIIFDLVQCIIERNFGYATKDVRTLYRLLKDCLVEEKHEKVVLIVHSQGGIQGSLVLDWLLSELPHDILQKLEIYTFGSAANHFNNPHRSAMSFRAAQVKSVPQTQSAEKAVRHIEHYANDADFVARWGVLSFNRIHNRYMGCVFIRNGSGHLLNQHYLNTMFPLDSKTKQVAEGEENIFMNTAVHFSSEGAAERAREGVFETLLNGGYGCAGAIVEDKNDGVAPVSIARAESVLAAKLANRLPKVRAFFKTVGV